MNAAASSPQGADALDNETYAFLCDVIGRKATLTVIDLLDERFYAARADTGMAVACCGPEPMMEAVAKWTTARGIPCAVSLETPMACGVGICFTCVARIRDASGGWDYRRTCVEGPVFDAAVVEW